MAGIAHFKKILKGDFFKKIKFFSEFLSARDIIDVAAAAISSLRMVEIASSLHSSQ